jgi:ketosteroid isomerase-like protein
MLVRTASDRPVSITAQQIESLLRAYFDACNAADAKTIAACFAADATHYFPANERYGPWRGGRRIADEFAAAARKSHMAWTIDAIAVDVGRAVAVVEWTQFRQRNGKRLRGTDWYVFDRASGLIAEVRAYFASDEHRGQSVHELGGFDYAGRGFAVAPPHSS